MKICVLTRTTSEHCVGGMEDHIRTLYTGLAKAGIKVHIITTGHPKGIESKTSDGIEYFFIKNAAGSAYTFNWWRGSIKKFVELHKKNRYDLIHSQSMGAYELAKRDLPKKLGLPFVSSFHGTPFDEYRTSLNLIKEKKGRFSKFDELIARANFAHRNYWLKKVSTSSDAVIATSNEQARIMDEVYGVSRNKIKVVFNGMNLDEFTPGMDTDNLRIKLQLAKEDKVLLCIARLEPDKGVQFVIDTMPELIKRGNKIKLVIVGDGSLRRMLENKVKEYGISDNVIFTGYVKFSDLPKYMDLADIFVNYTIRQNGYDLTMLEAMACETPVVASHIGSHPTLIKNGGNGFMVPLWDINNLVDTLHKVIENKALMRNIGKNARETVLSDFSDSAMVKGTIKVFESLVNRG
ncbi:glycosyltransferase family 4 protein [Candidatus Margulisiibacteriota bacterium]